MLDLQAPQFGHIPPKTNFIERPGSYALILNEQQQLALVKTDWGHIYLPGGGIEAGESKETALHREVMEETGLKIQIDRYIGLAYEFFYSRSQDLHFNKAAHFFRASITGTHASGPLEDDHQLIWVAPEEAAEILHTDAYTWIVQEELL